MELKSQREKIELKIEAASKEIADALPLQAVSSGHLSKVEPQVKAPLQPYTPPRMIAAIQVHVDVLALGCLGGFLGFLSVFIMGAVSLGARLANVMDLVVLLDASFGAAFLCGAFWIACSCFPVWMGLCVFVLQAFSGVFVGSIMVTILCNFLMVEPQTLGAMSGVWAVLFTLLTTLVPAFALPLYNACFWSSPLRRTIGAAFSDYQAADLRGNKLSFRQAWGRSIRAALEPFLYPTSIALGKIYANRKAWLDQSSKTMLVKRAEKLEEEINKSKETVMVRYRAFQEIEGVLGKDTENVPKVMRKIDVPFRRAFHAVWALSMVAMAVALPVAFQAPSNLARVFVMTGHVKTNPALLALTDIDGIFGGFWHVFAYVAIFFLLYFVLAICRPTHIQVSRQGVRFIFRMMPVFMQDAVCSWSKIQQVTLEQVPGKASVADHRLVFNLVNGKKMRLRLGSISSVAGKEEILKAVERWAPSLPRSPEVISALQPPCDFSYTELWMEALTAPPKREKLKPLIDGAVLRANQYTVLNMLGVGGQGTAYLAEDALSEQTVVLKEFLLPVYVDVSARRRALETFEKEARLLKELAHPNVVKLVDYFIEDHRAYMVLEHIDGKSLRNLVNQNGKLSEAEVRNLAKQMCEILTYLHTQSPPVVHRDFTPDNLILRKDGTLKLIDFNVAQQNDDSSALSSVVGKPNYLSPEQFRGSPVPQSDIYALGACLQFLLTGEDPVAILSSNPSLTRDDLSVEICSIVQKATEPELSNRYASAAEILRLLED